MQKYKSLTLRLSFSILSIVLAIFLIILAINHEVTRRYQLEDARLDAKNISKLTVSEIEEALSSVELPTNYLSEYLSQHKINSTEFATMLRLLTENDDRVISSFAVYFRNERRMDHEKLDYYFYKNGIDKDTLMRAYEGKIRAWSKKVQMQNKPYWSEPYMDSESGDLTSAYIVPAFIKQSDSMPIRGLIGVEFRLKWLKALIESKKTYKYDYVFILSKEGTPVMRPGGVFDQNTSIYQIAKDLNKPEIIDLANNMTSGKEGVLEIGGVFHDFNSVLYYMPVSSTKWSVAVVFPKSDLYKNLYRTTFILGISGLIGFILILLAVTFITRRMTRPLQELSSAAHEIGQGNLKVEMPDVKRNDEVKVLRESLNTMQKELQIYIKNLLNTEKFREKMESELKVARDIQMGYLRKDFASFSNDQAFNVVAAIKPAREIGGDFYDYFLLDNKTLCFAIGDVAGKGIPAALFMTIALTLTRAGNYANEKLGKVVTKINNVLVENNENSVFTTFLIGILNIENGELNFCNAGHNYPYLLKNNELFEIKATHGPAVGAIEEVSYKTGKMTIGNGDRIILYTDGVTDAENDKAEFYGKDRMEAIINKNMTKSIGDITSALIKDLKKYSGKSQQSDDITILAIEYLRDEKSSDA